MKVTRTQMIRAGFKSVEWLLALVAFALVRFGGRDHTPIPIADYNLHALVSVAAYGFLAVVTIQLIAIAVGDESPMAVTNNSLTIYTELLRLMSVIFP